MMADGETTLSISEVKEQQDLLRTQFRALDEALETRFGDTVGKQEALAAGEAHRALSSLAQWLGILSAEAGNAAMADPEAWRAALEAFVTRQVGQAVQSDVSRIADECRQEVERLRGEELAPLGQCVEEMRESLEQATGGAQGRLDAAQGSLALASERLDAAEGRLSALEALVASLGRAAEDLAAAPCGEPEG